MKPTIMGEDTDAPGGRPTKADPEAFKQVVEQKGMGTTAEVHDEVQTREGVQIDSSTARRRLQDLADRGRIVKRKTGASVTWMSQNAFTAVVDDSTFTDAIGRLGGLQTTEEIADETGFGETATLSRLQDLEDKGRVRSRNAGGDDATLWTVVD